MDFFAWAPVIHLLLLIALIVITLLMIKSILRTQNEKNKTINKIYEELQELNKEKENNTSE